MKRKFKGKALKKLQATAANAREAKQAKRALQVQNEIGHAMHIRSLFMEIRQHELSIMLELMRSMPDIQLLRAEHRMMVLANEQLEKIIRVRYDLDA